MKFIFLAEIIDFPVNSMQLSIYKGVIPTQE